MKLALGVLIGLLLAPAVAFLVAVSGLVDMSATRPPGRLEQFVGGTLADRSVERRAPRTKNPVQATPEALRAGLVSYREHCVLCHGAPGAELGDAGKGLNPPAPNLADPDVQGSSDGELFQIIGHGIRMTGMPGWLPTHSEREVWEMVAFVRHLPKVTPEERKALAAGEGGPRHEHGAVESR